MYKLCKSEQSATRQRELEQQLLTMMNMFRYEEITVSDFCIHAGIPRKAFYRYFSSKEGALHALIDHTLVQLEGFTATMQLDQENVRLNELAWFFRFWQEQKALLDALERNGLGKVLIERTIENATVSMAVSSRVGIRDMSDMREFGIAFAVSGFMTMVLKWHGSGYALRPEQMAELTMELLTKPLIRTITQ